MIDCGNDLIDGCREGAKRKKGLRTASYCRRLT